MARRRPTAPDRPPIIDRETSWIRFNDRVLEEAEDPTNPLLERLRFLNIWHTNLDEFFMIRVSGIKEQMAAGVQVVAEDDLPPPQRMAAIRRDVRVSLARAQRCLEQLMTADLPRADIHILRYADLTGAQRERWNAWYLERVHPILTPLAISPHLPFPFISNLALNVALHIEPPDGERRLARIKIPDHLPRYIDVEQGAELGDPPLHLVALTDLIAANLPRLFPNIDVSEPFAFRVTRDADVEIHEDEADDLLKSIEVELRKRRFGQAVRLEIDDDAPRSMVTELQRGLQIDENDVYTMTRVVDPSSLARLASVHAPGLKFRSFTARSRKDMTGPGIFHRIARGDVLLHHPFDSFTPVSEFVRQAARDPAVLAIKMTLYRTSGDSTVVQALLDAAEQGKQVAAVVELKARFDEKNNIVWARRLEEAGVHVIYGVPHLKTHAKLCLIVRREDAELRRYAHIGTGNYNQVTARVYTDLGLFTADPDITADVADLFNQITGFGQPSGFRKMLVAPRFMKENLIHLIHFETQQAKAGQPSGIIAKCNALTDRAIIDALYEASRAGVPVQLLVRGMCAMVPGRKGWSETTQVRSVVGRFLEHSRCYWFLHADQPQAWIGSADLMERNLDHRVEVLVPIQDEDIGAWIHQTFLQRYLNDQRRTRVMNDSGEYQRINAPTGAPDVHWQFMHDGQRRNGA